MFHIKHKMPHNLNVSLIEMKNDNVGKRHITHHLVTHISQYSLFIFKMNHFTDYWQQQIFVRKVS